MVATTGTSSCGGDKRGNKCHNGVNIDGAMYRPLSVVWKPGWEFLQPADRSRFQVTKPVEDDFAFMVPTSRDIELTAPCSLVIPHVRRRAAGRLCPS